MKQLLFIAILLSGIALPGLSQSPVSQFPSPMQETVRKHSRVHFDTTKGISFRIEDVLPKPIFVFIPRNVQQKKYADIYIHFMGSPEIVAHAAEKNKVIGVAVNLGSGSSVYVAPFKKPEKFDSLLKIVKEAISYRLNKSIVIKKLYIGCFSAGYGAIRAILSNEHHARITDGVLLLDGLHTGYIPERKLLADGGVIDSMQMQPFLNYVQQAVQKKSKKKFLFAHSEIFPGTFSSTTETAEFLSNAVGVPAKPILQSKPGGMQQISNANKNNFTVMGFAGNTAPDHLDYVHNLSYFLRVLKK
ncbi:MAG: hypothetical protein ACK5NK_10520 [Niabella sp.]